MEIMDNDIQRKVDELDNAKNVGAVQFKEFLTTEHNTIMENMKRDANNIGEHVKSIEPKLVDGLYKYVEIQITLLLHLKLIIEEGIESTKEIPEIVEKSESSSHCIGEIVAILKQQNPG